MAKYVVGCTVDDVPHFDDKYKEDYKKSIPPHQRSARLRGEPGIGSGACYPIDESMFVIDYVEVRPHWKRVFALDVGQHSAALWGAIDPNTGCMYIYDEAEWLLKDMGVIEAMPPMIVHSIQSRGKWIKGVVDPSALQGSKRGDGDSLYKEYKRLGLNLITKVDNGIESGITRNINMIYAGKLKIVKTCRSLLNEMRTYSRGEDGRIGRHQKDHLLDCLRYVSGTGYKVARSLNEVEFEVDQEVMGGMNYNYFDSRNETTGY